MNVSLPALLLGLVFLSGGCDKASAPGLPAPGPKAQVIEIEVTPADSVVTIDGVALPPGASRTVTLNPGPHRLRATKSGYFTQEAPFRVGSDESRVIRVNLISSH